MKKAELEKELTSLSDAAIVLQERAELELKTSQFLCKEGDKLLEKYNTPATPFDEKEELTKQMTALQRRMECEVSLFEKDVINLKRLEIKLEELRLIVESGLVKE